MKNSFLELQQMEIAEFQENRQDIVREKVAGRLRTTEFFGDVLELFFPKMADTLTVMMGGEAIEGQDDYSRISEKTESTHTNQRLEAGPEDRDEIIR